MLWYDWNRVWSDVKSVITKPSHTNSKFWSYLMQYTTAFKLSIWVSYFRPLKRLVLFWICPCNNPLWRILFQKVWIPLESRDENFPVYSIGAVLQAQQEVPEWLETYSKSAMGYGGGSNFKSNFGGRDIRKDQPRVSTNLFLRMVLNYISIVGQNEVDNDFAYVKQNPTGVPVTGSAEDSWFEVCRFNLTVGEQCMDEPLSDWW